MKLYVWNNPYDVKWGGSCLYVVASNMKEARRLAKDALIYKFGWSSKEGHKLGDIKLGHPDRITPVPCAEVYHHEE